MRMWTRGRSADKAVAADDPAPAAPPVPAERPREEPSRGAARREEPRRPGLVVRALVALVAVVGMVAFAIVLARLTLNASPASVPLTHSNLTPGSSIRAYLGQPEFVETVKQLGGNVLLGVPFGILLPLLSRRTRGLVRVALLTVVTMLFVELVQGALITGRAFDDARARRGRGLRAAARPLRLRPLLERDDLPAP
ncbi:VanZ family protein, partial [Streptomyces sp. NPDC006324]|uniref:VanZ family protein n=1 Tax=Streptomyces sp. NPDC006324 TaxID=3156751 RepID=UPI0033B6FFF0